MAASMASSNAAMPAFARTAACRRHRRKHAQSLFRSACQSSFRSACQSSAARMRDRTFDDSAVDDRSAVDRAGDPGIHAIPLARFVCGFLAVPTCRATGRWMAVDAGMADNRDPSSWTLNACLKHLVMVAERSTGLQRAYPQQGRMAQMRYASHIFQASFAVVGRDHLDRRLHALAVKPWCVKFNAGLVG